MRGPVALHRCGAGGAIIGVMWIADVIPAAETLRRYPDQGPYIIGPLCWVIADYRPLPSPVPCKGWLHLWESPPLGPLA